MENCLSIDRKVKREFNLEENQRIVGFKSNPCYSSSANQKDFQFVLMTPVTKTVLLKIIANKS